MQSASPHLAATTRDDFVRHPLGRVVFGPRYLVWCRDAALCGVGYWDAPSVEDMRGVLPLCAIDKRMQVPFDVLTDGSRVTGLDSEAFDVIERYVEERHHELARCVRRHAIVQPGGVFGSAMLGVYPKFGAEIVTKAFGDAASALAWLGRPDAEGLAAELARLTAEAIAGPNLVRQVRSILAGKVSATLEEVAVAIGVSDRTVQRALRAGGSSFSVEVDRARFTLARDRLEAGERLGTIAERVGLSRKCLSALLGRVSGESSKQFVARCRESAPRERREDGGP